MTEKQNQQKQEQSAGQTYYSTTVMKYQAVIKNYVVNIDLLTCDYINDIADKKTTESYYILYFYKIKLVCIDI